MISSTAPLSDAFAPSPRLTRLRHELASLVSLQERIDGAMDLDAYEAYFGDEAAGRRADAACERSIRLDREIAAVRRAIIAEANARAVAR